jgi:hypothetical protein
MKQISQNKTTLVLKKRLFIGLILFTITFIEFCWSVGDFPERISRGYLDCTVSESVYLMSLQIAVFLTIVFLLLSIFKKIYLKSAIKLILLILIWGFLNYIVFIDSESSWSTYYFEEEFLYTISFSIVPVLVLSIAAIVSINYISRIKKHNNKNISLKKPFV